MRAAWCCSRRLRCWGERVDGQLVFSAPHDGSGRLVLGDQGSGGFVPDVVLSVDADLPGLGGLMLYTGMGLSVDAMLPGLDGTVDLLWDANVSRGTRAELQACWQQGQPVAGAIAPRWQQAALLRCAVRAPWQDGAPRAGALFARWQDTERLRAAVGARWQSAVARRTGLVAAWQDAERLRAALWLPWQEGGRQRASLVTGWQEMVRLRAVAAARWQAGVAMRHAVQSHWSEGLPVAVHLRSRWQAARRPPSGVTATPTPPPRVPCYDPATLGRLVFTELAGADARLVFICQRPGQVLPPAAIVVLPRRSYIVINSVEVRRADDLASDPLPSESFNMRLDRRSWSWDWSGSFHRAARDALMHEPGGTPVELEVRVNGQPFRLLAEKVGMSKRFPEHVVTVSGRGKSAMLAAPHALTQTFSHALDRTAQQLMTEVLTINGVGFGWSVDFQITDWLVPGGLWMHQGTWISALADIASAVGGYLQPHDTEPVLHVLPSSPAPWWEWDTLAPHIELPAGYAEIEDREIIDQPDYTRIFVSGEAAGITADLTRSGTSGSVLKQMAVHPLITTIGAAKQRARAELSESGRAIKDQLTMMIQPQTGVIKPGTVLRYTDSDNATRLGIVRATSISSQFPVLTQTLEVDSHV